MAKLPDWIQRNMDRQDAITKISRETANNFQSTGIDDGVEGYEITRVAIVKGRKRKSRIQVGEEKKEVVLQPIAGVYVAGDEITSLPLRPGGLLTIDEAGKLLKTRKTDLQNTLRTRRTDPIYQIA